MLRRFRIKTQMYFALVMASVSFLSLSLTALHFIGVTRDVGLQGARQILHKAQEDKLKASVHTVAVTLNMSAGP